MGKRAIMMLIFWYASNISEWLHYSSLLYILQDMLCEVLARFIFSQVRAEQLWESSITPQDEISWKEPHFVHSKAHCTEYYFPQYTALELKCKIHFCFFFTQFFGHEKIPGQFCNPYSSITFSIFQFTTCTDIISI